MPESVRCGPNNPDPLSRIKTEWVWDGKYDEYGARRPVDIAGSAMPRLKNRESGKPQERSPGRKARLH
jgi:adenine-specific DNA-methyltransferase